PCRLPRAPPLPYTTLFRSAAAGSARGSADLVVDPAAGAGAGARSCADARRAVRGRGDEQCRRRPDDLGLDRIGLESALSGRARSAGGGEDAERPVDVVLPGGRGADARTPGFGPAAAEEPSAARPLRGLSSRHRVRGDADL